MKGTEKDGTLPGQSQMPKPSPYPMLCSCSTSNECECTCPIGMAWSNACFALSSCRS